MADGQGADVPDARKRASGAVYKPPYSGIATFMRQELREKEEDWAGVEIGLTGMPFDGAVTNGPGTRHGPLALREQSTLMGRINHQTRARPYDWASSADLGDVMIEGVYELDRAIGEIEAYYARVVAAGVMPLTGGGDHAITLPILRAIAGHRGGPVGLIHFDAHCDTGPELFGHKHHHGGPFKVAVEDGVLDPRRTIQIGIRGPAEALWDFSYSSGMTVIHIEELYAMDPVYAPGTGTPEVGGFTAYEAQQMLRGLRGLDIVGGDVVEVSPPFDSANVTSLNGAQMMWEIMCLMAEKIGRANGRLDAS